MHCARPLLNIGYLLSKRPELKFFPKNHECFGLGVHKTKYVALWIIDYLGTSHHRPGKEYTSQISEKIGVKSLIEMFKRVSKRSLLKARTFRKPERVSELARTCMRETFQLLWRWPEVSRQRSRMGKCLMHRINYVLRGALHRTVRLVIPLKSRHTASRGVHNRNDIEGLEQAADAAKLGFHVLRALLRFRTTAHCPSESDRICKITPREGFEYKEAQIDK